MDIPPEVLAAIVAQAIAAGLARCSACELPVTDPDEDVMATVCPDCGELEIMHASCAEHELGRKEMVHAKARANWRWN